MGELKTKLLSDFKIGESGIIDSFRDEEFSIKLMEMGCLPGVRVTVSIIAPLGDPIAVIVNGYQLGIRKREAKTINIKID